MNPKQTTAAIGAALLMTTSPLVASAAQTPLTPIRLDTVQIAQSFGILDNWNEPGLVTIAFTNQSAVPATRVVFALEAGGVVVDRFTNVGTFRPGATITNDFREGSIALDEELAVESVTFADGTTWSNLRALSRRQSTQTPAAENASSLTAEQIRETSPNAL